MRRIHRRLPWFALAVGVCAGACATFGSDAAPPDDNADAAAEGSTGGGADSAPADATDAGSDAPSAPLAAIALGAAHSCAVTEDASVLCWGDNARGQLGYAGDASITPVRVAGLPPAIGLAAGAKHTCAVDPQGALWCWGDNMAFQLPLGLPQGGWVPPSPALAPVGTTGNATVTHAAGGTTLTCAVIDGGAYCSGSNGNGELGRDGGASSRFVDVPGATNASAVAAGASHACALVTGGALCWGSNVLGACGVSDAGTVPPSAVELGDAGRPIAIAAGFYHTCIVDDAHHLYCWGQSACGAGGPNGPTVPARRVATVGSVQSVATNENVTCTVDLEGRVACLGSNAAGQLGIGTASMACPNNVATPIPNLRAKAVAVGHSHACALPIDGGVVCWGANDAGQLGTGTLEPQSSPAPVVMP